MSIENMEYQQLTQEYDELGERYEKAQDALAQAQETIDRQHDKIKDLEEALEDAERDALAESERLYALAYHAPIAVLFDLRGRALGE